MSHSNDPDVLKLSEENGSTKNHNEVRQPSWKTVDLLPTNLADILEHQNTDVIDDDEFDLNHDTRWSSDKYDKEIDCNVHSDDEFVD